MTGSVSVPSGLAGRAVLVTGGSVSYEVADVTSEVDMARVATAAANRDAPRFRPRARAARERSEHERETQRFCAMPCHPSASQAMDSPGRVGDAPPALAGADEILAASDVDQQARESVRELRLGSDLLDPHVASVLSPTAFEGTSTVGELRGWVFTHQRGP